MSYTITRLARVELFFLGGEVMLPNKTLMSMTVVGLFLMAAWGQAQSAPAPKILQVSPIGGQAGSTFELTIAGSDLDKAEGLHFSFPGAKVEIVGASKVEPVDPKKKPPQGMKGPGPQVSQNFKVTLPAKMPLGIHDVRVVTKGGVSNPRAFVVSDNKEELEKEPNDNVDKAQKVDLNTSISGVISAPVDVDYFQFTGKKGQRVLLSCLATSVDSKLPAQIELYTAGDKFLGSNRAYQNNDALLDVTLPEDGSFLVRLFSFTYTQGGPDYFYRLTITTGPWIDAVIPAAVEPGKESKLTVYGRNLPKGTSDPTSVVDGRMLEKITVGVSADAKAQALLSYHGHVSPGASGLDGFTFTLNSGAGTSNPYLLGFARGPAVLEGDKNDTTETAQTVTAPCEITGRIEKKGDRDYFSFSAKKGQVLNLELISERRGAPTDLYFELFSVKDGKANLIVKQEDTPDVFGVQFPNPTYDPSAYRFVVPADGTYQVLVTSLEAFTQFGPRHVYTMRIAAEEPDFRLIAMPASNQGPDAVILGQAGHQAYSLFVYRMGGFSGDIIVSGENLPAGVTMKPQVVAGNQIKSAFVVSAAPEAPPSVSPLKLIGTAVIGGKKVNREVRSATITWPVQQQQGNVPTIGRLDRELMLAVRDKAPYSLAIEKDKIVLPQGDKLSIPVKISFGDFKGNITLTAAALPTGMVMQPLTIGPGKDTVQLTFDSKATVLPGNYTVVVRGQTQDPKGKPPTKPGGAPNIVQAAPPVTVSIVPKQLAKLAAPGNLKVGQGKEADLVVKLSRQFDYAGAFKVELVAPPGVKGISADPVTLKAGEDDAKLVVRVAKDAPPGQSPTVVVRATALFNDSIPVVHEAKVTINIGK